MRRVRQEELARQVSKWEAKQLVQGDLAHRSGDLIRAMRKFVKILQRNPRCWPARFSVAVILHQACEHEAAVFHLEKVVKAVPGFLEAWYNLGTFQQSLGRYAASEASLRRALELDPTYVAALVNLGNAVLGQGRPAEAGTIFEEALRHKPGNAEALWNLAHVLILRGDWVRGWAAYEARWSIPGFVELNAVTVDESRQDLPVPWRGAPIAGRSLVVIEEQGWGDSIMCLRYAPLLRAMGATTTWAVRPELVRLAELAVAPDRVVSIRDPIPGTDYCVTAMTLHQRLGITPESVPGANGYLRVA